MRASPWAVLLFGVAVVACGGCDALQHRETGPSPTPSTGQKSEVVHVSVDEINKAVEEAKKKEERANVGRFQLLYAPATPGPLVLRMDTTTGETWRLDYASGVKWTSVADHLQSIGTYNPTTKQVEWGVRVPDGRDLSALSKEELLRLASAVIESHRDGSTKKKYPWEGAEGDHVWTPEEVKKLREQQSSGDPLGLFTPEENAKRKANKK